MSIRLEPEHLDLEAVPKLKIVSLRQLEFKLGLKRGYLRPLAAKAGAHYDPFVKPEKHRPFQKIFKASKKRVIDNPDRELKDVQKRIYRRLLRPLTLPGYIHGGVKHRTLLDNVRMHLGATTLVTIDIAQFFPSVTNEHVYFLWIQVLNCSPEISSLLTRLTTFGRHLPQGAATSTPLANILISVIDKQIRTECAQKGVKYSTWVDDLAFSGDNARELIPVVIHVLRRVGFRVSRKKLKVMGTTARKILNGVILGKRAHISKKQLSFIRAGLHKLAIGLVPTADQDSYLRSLVARIRQANIINASQVRNLRLQLMDLLKTGSFSKYLKKKYLQQLCDQTPAAKVVAALTPEVNDMEHVNVAGGILQANS